MLYIYLQYAFVFLKLFNVIFSVLGACNRLELISKNSSEMGKICLLCIQFLSIGVSDTSVKSSRWSRNARFTVKNISSFWMLFLHMPLRILKESYPLPLYCNCIGCFYQVKQMDGWEYLLVCCYYRYI